MNIVFAESYYDSFTGAQQSMLPLLTQSEAIQAHAITTSEGKFTKEIRQRDIPCTTISCPPHLESSGESLTRTTLRNILRVGSSLLRFQPKVGRVLHNLGPDILYCNNLRALLLFGPAAKVLGVPVIWYVRNDKSAGFVDLLGLSLSDHVITISDGVKSRFEYTPTLITPEIETLYTGLDTMYYSRERTKEACEDKIEKLRTDDQFVVTEVASINSRKNQLELLRAGNRILEEDELEGLKIRFVGEFYDNSYKAKVKEYVEDNDLERIVEFHGWQEDTRPYYYTTDVLALPSLNEGLPRTILESLALKTAVIATPAGGTREIVKDGETGLLFPMNDHKALADCMNRLYHNSELRDRLRTQGYRSIQQSHTIETYVTNFEAIAKRVS